MPLYESTLIARPDISGQQVEGLSEQFQAIVRDNGGAVAKTEYWGLRSLTYRIKKNRKGHYLHMQIDAPAEAVDLHLLHELHRLEPRRPPLRRGLRRRPAGGGHRAHEYVRAGR